MNEILMRKHIKQVMKYGIAKDTAVDIVHTAMAVSTGNSLDNAINYAIDLVYGLGFTQRMRAK